MSSEDEAKAAIASLDGYSVKGSHIHVEVCWLIRIKYLFLDSAWLLPLITLLVRIPVLRAQLYRLFLADACTVAESQYRVKLLYVIHYNLP